MSTLDATADAPRKTQDRVEVRVVVSHDARSRSDVRRSRSQAARRVVLRTIAFLLILHFGLATAGEYWPSFRDPAYADKAAKLHQRLDLLHHAQRARLILALGSSRTLLGFDASRAETQLGSITASPLVAFNFGTPASGPITHLLQYRRLQREGIRPDLLVLEVLIPALQDGLGGPVEAAFLTGDRLDGSEADTVCKYGFDEAATRCARRGNWTSPWWSLRHRLLARVAPSWVPDGLRCDWSRTTDAHGWSTPPRQTIGDEERAEREAKVRADFALPLSTLEPEGRPLAALRQLLAECRRDAVEVRLLVMPEDSKFRRLYSAVVESRTLAALNRVAAEASLPFVNAREWLPDDAFYDGHHMFTVGAHAYTDRLVSEMLRPYLRGKAGAP